MIEDYKGGLSYGKYFRQYKTIDGHIITVKHLAMADIPKSMRGVAITLVTAGILALAFMGFSVVDGGLKPIFGLD